MTTDPNPSENAFRTQATFTTGGFLLPDFLGPFEPLMTDSDLEVRMMTFAVVLMDGRAPLTSKLNPQHNTPNPKKTIFLTFWLEKQPITRTTTKVERMFLDSKGLQRNPCKSGSDHKFGF